MSDRMRCSAPVGSGLFHICDALNVWGFQAPGVAQDLFVTEAEKVMPLPDSLTFEQGALVEPAAVAVHATGRTGDMRAIALTKGETGSFLCTPYGKAEHAGFPPDRAVDTVGAGDSFAAAMVMGLLRGGNLGVICAHANRLAT